MSVDDLVSTLKPAARLVANLDLSDPRAAEAALSSAFAQSWQHAVGKLVHELAEQGKLTPKVASEGLSFGRLSKVNPDLAGCTLDAVDMAADAVGAKHRHPSGEVSLCFPVSGQPAFEGVHAGWQVQPPGSEHAPVVTDGRMRILYFLPDGDVQWL